MENTYLVFTYHVDTESITISRKTRIRILHDYTPMIASVPRFFISEEDSKFRVMEFSSWLDEPTLVKTCTSTKEALEFILDYFKDYTRESKRAVVGLSEEDLRNKLQTKEWVNVSSLFATK